ncbi:MAG: flagellar M-ring protein FliF [Deltaproteobacteria bacterium]|nr:flagellar M-ring protein FliF [Deltaproteobacteria bacterium]MBN2673711.1 flagellar M-ring protein FliF [Deltaproteobacteria bacterium]
MAQDKEKAVKQRQPKEIAQETLVKAKGYWDRQPKTLKASVVIIGVLMLGAVAMLVTVKQTSFRTLYNNLTPEDASAIIEYVKGKKIEYELEDGGTRILVPEEAIHELRLELATEGLPTGGGVGFELFDKQQFGMTEFEERVAMRRALEGELSRTIARIKVVKNAKANLVLPKRTLLGKEASQAQASVILELHRGRELPEGTISAIIHLVSSSVEGLSPDHVTIVDTNGKLLSSKSDVGGNGGEGMEYKKRYEQNIENSVQQMLDQLVGPGKSITRVAADFDFSQSETQEEHYDPAKTAVRSERKELEITGTQTGGGEGIPGTRSNLPGGETPGSNNSKTNARKELETRNWEIDKVVKKTVGAGTELERVTVSVLVDGANKEGEKFVPRSKDELKKIEMAVQGAIGYSKTRGDSISVQSISFHQPEPLNEEDIKPPFPWKHYLPVAVGILVVIFAFLALMTFRRKGGAAQPLTVSTAQLLSMPRPVHELESMIEEQNRQLPPADQLSKEQLANLPDMSIFNAPPGLEEYAHRTSEMMAQVKNIFEEDSETAARIIKKWIHDKPVEENS